MQYLTTTNILTVKNKLLLNMVNNNECINDIDKHVNAHIDYCLRINSYDKVKIVNTVTKGYEIIRLSNNNDFISIANNL